MMMNIDSRRIKKALILGMGLSGKAAFDFLKKRGVEVLGMDQNPQDSKTIKDQLAGLNLKDFDCLVVSPGISLDHPVVLASLQADILVKGEVELALPYLQCKVIGITGTNGKTTVTQLVAHTFKDLGKTVFVAGNIGFPLLSLIEQKGGEIGKEAIVVLELSSYQLESLVGKGERGFFSDDLKKLDAALFLNLSPDHLERHQTLANYLNAKMQIQKLLKPKGVFFIHQALCKGVNAVCYQQFSSFFDKWTSLEAENGAAAFALCQAFGVTLKQFLKSYATFSKPLHRLQKVAVHKGVIFFDDSKATNTAATLKAVETIEAPIHLIAGGVDKKGGYQDWVVSFPGKVKSLHLIGQAASLIAQALEGQIPCFFYASLEEATLGAFGFAKSEEVVLLSPGCASYDMFKDYAHRGDVFQETIKLNFVK